MTKVYANTSGERRQELGKQLEAIADRICDFQERLEAGMNTLSASKYCQLLAEYYSECKRYNLIDRELEILEEPKKAKKYKEMQQRQNRENREKINY